MVLVPKKLEIELIDEGGRPGQTLTGSGWQLQRAPLNNSWSGRGPVGHLSCHSTVPDLSLPTLFTTSRQIS